MSDYVTDSEKAFQAVSTALWDFVDGDGGIPDILALVAAYGRHRYSTGWDDGFNDAIHQSC